MSDSSGPPAALQLTSPTSGGGGGGGGGEGAAAPLLRSPMLAAQSQSTPLSHTDVRGGLDMLRAQVSALQNENESLKTNVAQLERERHTEVRRIRLLLGRSMVRHHTQSFKLRRMLVQLHTQVLDVAELLNKEQQVSERADNIPGSVQTADDEQQPVITLPGGTAVAAAAAAAQADDDGSDRPSHHQSRAGIEARLHFLTSLTKLRPSRVGRALQENLERLFASMGEVLSRCPKYRSELDFSFQRNIELKESLLATQAAHAATAQQNEEAQQRMHYLQSQMESLRAKNDDLARDMRLTIDMERRRRQRENAEQIKVRTSLYKRVLADKHSPLHPANLAKIGKNGTNILMALAAQLQAREAADAGSTGAAGGEGSEADRAAAQQAYYLERRMAVEQEEAAAAAAQKEEEERIRKEEEAAALQADQSPDAAELLAMSAADREAALAARAAAAAAAAEAERQRVMNAYQMPADGAGFEARKTRDIAELRSDNLAGYRFAAGELESAAAAAAAFLAEHEAVMQREAEEKQNGGGNGGGLLPPIAGLGKSASTGKLPYASGYYPSLKLKADNRYTANTKAFAAYSHSNAWMREQANEAARQKAALTFAALPAEREKEREKQSGESTSPSPPEGSKSKRATGDAAAGPVGSFSSAARIYPHKVGVGGNRVDSHSPTNAMENAPKWVDNFGTAAALAAQAHAAAMSSAATAAGSSTSATATAASAHASLPRLVSPLPASRSSPAAAKSKRSQAAVASGGGSDQGASSAGDWNAASAAQSGSANGASDWASADLTSPLYADDASVVVTTHVSSVFKFAQQQPPLGGGFGAGGGGSGAGGLTIGAGSGAFRPHARGAGGSMSRRPPSLYGSPVSAKKASSPSHSAVQAGEEQLPQHLRTIPASPRREAGLF